MMAPSATEFELIPISYMPPALSLYLYTSSLRSASSPWPYQYVRLALLSSGGWPAATAADSLANCSGEPGIDCHSTLSPFCLPQSTKVLPTASSVTVFQLAENHTLKTPLLACDACAGFAGVAAAAAVVGAGAAWPPGGAVVGFGAVVESDAAGPHAAATARPTIQAFLARNCRREKIPGRRSASIIHPLGAARLPRLWSPTDP